MYSGERKETQRLQLTLGRRDRVNINAIINAKDPIEVIVEGCKTVNTQTTKAFFFCPKESSVNFSLSDN